MVYITCFDFYDFYLINNYILTIEVILPFKSYILFSGSMFANNVDPDQTYISKSSFIQFSVHVCINISKTLIPLFISNLCHCAEKLIKNTISIFFIIIKKNINGLF